VSERADYVIVGGGVYGCATAWHLASRGARVLVLEGKQLAFGASGGLGKRGVRANGRDIRELPLMRLAYEIWPTLEADLKAPTGFVRTGQLRLIERPRDWDESVVRQKAQSRMGIETRLLDRSQTEALVPGMADSILGALHCPNDGAAAHEATTLAYAEAAKQAGATFREGVAVTGLVRENGRVRAVTTMDGEEIPVGRSVFLLNNGGVPALLQNAFSVELPVWSRFPQVLVTTPPEGFSLHHLLGHAHRKLSMKMVHDNRLMISGGWSGHWNGQESVPNPAQVAGNLDEARAVFPALASCEAESVDVSRAESQSLDSIPVIDRLADNVFFATGWSGHGWAIAPAVAPLLSEWALSGACPEVLRPFHLGRFGEGGPQTTRNTRKGL